MERSKVLSITKGRTSPPKWPNDPKELPIYDIVDVARSLRVDETVLSDWTKPRFEHGRRKENFEPLIALPESGLAEGRFSFYNALEAHMLLLFRRFHKIPMLDVRRAVKWVSAEIPSKHPLVDYSFSTKGKHLFVKGLGPTFDANRYGQQILSLLDLYLTRIHRDDSGFAFRLFPIVPGTKGETEPVMMDIRYASGRLVVAETGVLASVIDGRHKAGHSIERLARDYRLPPEKIQGAIDYLRANAA
jgi:uncharacterized protein (DUF433 family)